MTFDQIRKTLDRSLKWLLIIPALVIMIGTVIFPAAWVLLSSFHVKNYLRQEFYFAGLGNYITLLTDPAVHSVLRNTALYVIGSVGIGFFVALGIARLLSSKIKLGSMFLVIAILPWMFPKISGCIMWHWIFHQLYGVANYVLVKLGIVDQFIAFLAKSELAFPLLIGVDIWYWTPLAILILFGGFSRVPSELVDAAKVDGANWLQIFQAIEIPCVLPEILVVLTLRTMFTFREFGIPYLMTGGGPGRSTETIGLTVYRLGIMQLQLGIASALSIIMLIITVVFVSTYWTKIKRATLY